MTPEDPTGQPQGTTAPAEPAQGTEQGTEQAQAPTYEIDGEKYTADQIKEWRQSGLRQEDYTRKTQELAGQRQQFDSFNQWLEAKPAEVIEAIRQKYGDRLGEAKSELAEAVEEEGAQSKEAKALRTEIANLKSQMGQMQNYEMQKAQQEQSREIHSAITGAIESDKSSKDMHEAARKMVERSAVTRLWALANSKQITPEDVKATVSEAAKEVKTALDAHTDAYVKSKSEEARAPVAGSRAGVASGKSPDDEVPDHMDSDAFRRKLDNFTRTHKGE